MNRRAFTDGSSRVEAELCVPAELVGEDAEEPETEDPLPVWS